MTLHVIGAGLGRTGTLSIKAALEEIGFGPCYHMYELVGAHPDHALSWNAANRGDADALRIPLADYQATVDWPGCVLWRELTDRVVRERTFGTHFDLDAAAAVIAAYEAHNDAVRASVSPERLLEFDVDDGWVPLCAFLGVPVPSTPFPRKNDGAQFRQIFGLDAATDEGPAFDETELAALQDRMRAAL